MNHQSDISELSEKSEFPCCDYDLEVCVDAIYNSESRNYDNSYSIWHECNRFIWIIRLHYSWWVWQCYTSVILCWCYLNNNNNMYIICFELHDCKKSQVLLGLRHTNQYLTEKAQDKHIEWLLKKQQIHLIHWEQWPMLNALPASIQFVSWFQFSTSCKQAAFSLLCCFTVWVS